MHCHLLYALVYFNIVVSSQSTYLHGYITAVSTKAESLLIKSLIMSASIYSADTWTFMFCTPPCSPLTCAVNILQWSYSIIYKRLLVMNEAVINSPFIAVPPYLSSCCVRMSIVWTRAVMRLNTVSSAIIQETCRTLAPRFTLKRELGRGRERTLTIHSSKICGRKKKDLDSHNRLLVANKSANTPVRVHFGLLYCS